MIFFSNYEDYNPQNNENTYNEDVKDKINLNIEVDSIDNNINDGKEKI